MPPPTPPEIFRGSGALERHAHTSKVLFAVERFNELLMLPTNIAAHTPFIICMIASIAKTQFAACRYLYSGQQLQLARERIRLSMGALKALGEYWPLGKRTYQELGVIARDVLSLDPKHRQNETLAAETFQQIPATTDMSPPYFLPPDNAFSFNDLYDLNLHQAMDAILPMAIG